MIWYEKNLKLFDTYKIRHFLVESKIISEYLV